MAAMFVWMIMMMMMSRMMMVITECDNPSGSNVQVLYRRAVSGEPVLLTSHLEGSDFRWGNTQCMQLSLNKNRTTCPHKRCELQRNGSLRFSHVHTTDTGNYTLEVFGNKGERKEMKIFVLTVEDPSSSSRSTSVVLPASLCCSLLSLLLFFIIVFILRKRRSQSRTPAELMEEPLYLPMHSDHGYNKKEECDNVRCDPAVSMGTSIRQQSQVDMENIYM